MIIPYIFLLGKLLKIQPPWLCQHPEKNSSSYCDNSLHFTSLGSKDMPRNPSPTGQPNRWSKATQLLFFNRLSKWCKHATSRMSIILNTSRGVFKNSTNFFEPFRTWTKTYNGWIMAALPSTRCMNSPQLPCLLLWLLCCLPRDKLHGIGHSLTIGATPADIVLELEPRSVGLQAENTLED